MKRTNRNTITRPEHESRPQGVVEAEAKRANATLRRMDGQSTAGNTGRPRVVQVKIIETPDRTTETTMVDGEVRQVETTDANATAWRLFGKLALGGAK